MAFQIVKVSEIPPRKGRPPDPLARSVASAVANVASNEAIDVSVPVDKKEAFRIAVRRWVLILSERRCTAIFRWGEYKGHGFVPCRVYRVPAKEAAK